MKKNEKGILTIEASIVLTMFMFFILFFYSFARIYKAQSVVSHATLQCAQSLAVESYLRETVSETNAATIVEFIIKISGAETTIDDNFFSLNSDGTDLNGAIRKNFALAIAENETEANKILLKCGIKEGLNGISFEDSKIDDSDIIVKTTYTVKFQFPLFGKEEISLTKAAKSRSFKEIGD